MTQESGCRNTVSHSSDSHTRKRAHSHSQDRAVETNHLGLCFRHQHHDRECEHERDLPSLSYQRFAGVGAGMGNTKNQVMPMRKRTRTEHGEKGGELPSGDGGEREQDGDGGKRVRGRRRRVMFGGRHGGEICVRGEGERDNGEAEDEEKEDGERRCESGRGEGYLRRTTLCLSPPDGLCNSHVHPCILLEALVSSLTSLHRCIRRHCSCTRGGSHASDLSSPCEGLNLVPEGENRRERPWGRRMSHVTNGEEGLCEGEPEGRGRDGGMGAVGRNVAAQVGEGGVSWRVGAGVREDQAMRVAAVPVGRGSNGSRESTAALPPSVPTNTTATTTMMNNVPYPTQQSSRRRSCTTNASTFSSTPTTALAGSAPASCASSSRSALARPETCIILSSANSDVSGGSGGSGPLSSTPSPSPSPPSPPPPPSRSSSSVVGLAEASSRRTSAAVSELAGGPSSIPTAARRSGKWPSSVPATSIQKAAGRTEGCGTSARPVEGGEDGAHAQGGCRTLQSSRPEHPNARPTRDDGHSGHDECQYHPVQRQMLRTPGVATFAGSADVAATPRFFDNPPSSPSRLRRGYGYSRTRCGRAFHEPPTPQPQSSLTGFPGSGKAPTPLPYEYPGFATLSHNDDRDANLFSPPPLPALDAGHQDLDIIPGSGPLRPPYMSPTIPSASLPTGTMSPSRTLPQSFQQSQPTPLQHTTLLDAPSSPPVTTTTHSPSHVPCLPTTKSTPVPPLPTPLPPVLAPSPAAPPVDPLYLVPSEYNIAPVGFSSSYPPRRRRFSNTRALGVGTHNTRPFSSMMEAHSTMSALPTEPHMTLDRAPSSESWVTSPSEGE